MVVFLIGYKRLLKTMLKLLKTMFYCGTVFGFFLHHSGRIPHFSPHTPPPPIHSFPTPPPLPHAPPPLPTHTNTPHRTYPPFPTSLFNTAIISTLSPTNPVKSTLFPALIPHFYPTFTPHQLHFQPHSNPQNHPIFTPKSPQNFAYFPPL